MSRRKPAAPRRHQGIHEHEGIVKTAAVYFGITFSAGFVLGFVRVGWIAPRLGARTAELVEMPIMLVVMILAARRAVRGLPAPRTAPRRLGAGVAALGFLLLAEVTLVLWLRGQTISEYLAGRDPVTGTAYAVSLILFAVMPLVAARSDIAGSPIIWSPR